MGHNWLYIERAPGRVHGFFQRLGLVSIFSMGCAGYLGYVVDMPIGDHISVLEVPVIKSL